jgi:hypothetical protein
MASIQTTRSHVKHAGQAHGQMTCEMNAIKMKCEIEAQKRLTRSPPIHDIQAAKGVCPVPVTTTNKAIIASSSSPPPRQ